MIQRLNSLSARQAAKWFLLHEKERHLEDVKAIENDLAKLEDVELPEELAQLAGKIRFEV